MHKIMTRYCDSSLGSEEKTLSKKSLQILDLNDFSLSPSVTVDPTGNSATLSRYGFSPFVFLEHNPDLDAPQIFPKENSLLEFEFNFIKDPLTNDEFGAFLIDNSGQPLGSKYEFFSSDSGKGVVSFNLSKLPSDPIGLVVFLAEINAVVDVYDSSVIISNVRVYHEMTSEPVSSKLMVN